MNNSFQTSSEVDVQCDKCKKTFKRSVSFLANHKLKKYNHLFCSKPCSAAFYNHERAVKADKTLVVPFWDPEYEVRLYKEPNSNGRRWVWYKGFGSKKGKDIKTLYARYVMEMHLGRYLLSEETIDHIDKDRLNDSIENLQILSKSDHTTLDNRRVKKIETKCIWCKKDLLRSPAKIHSASKRGRAGPFCGKSCRGSYGASVRKDKKSKLSPMGEIPTEDREYFFIDKK